MSKIVKYAKIYAGLLRIYYCIVKNKKKRNKRSNTRLGYYKLLLLLYNIKREKKERDKRKKDFFPIQV